MKAGRTLPIAHGTYAGYTGGCRCDQCRAANATYGRKYRESSNYQLRESRARRRALTNLAHAHPDEFAELLNNERSKNGLPPVGSDGRGSAFFVEAES